MSVRLALIAALARDRVIGADNRLPWHLPEDLRRFRELTRGQCVIMGRKTWESLPANFRPLPERRNIVLSRQADYVAPGAEHFVSLQDALEKIGQVARKEEEKGEEEGKAKASVFVIGGEQIYRAALPLAERLYLTEIDLAAAGDAHFPEFSRDDWQEIQREEHVSKDGIPFAFVTYILRDRCA